MRETKREIIWRTTDRVGGRDGLIMECSRLLQIVIITWNYCAPFHSRHAIIMRLSEWISLVWIHKQRQRNKRGRGKAKKNRRKQWKGKTRKRKWMWVSEKRKDHGPFSCLFTRLISQWPFILGDWIVQQQITSNKPQTGLDAHSEVIHKVNKIPYIYLILKVQASI